MNHLTRELAPVTDAAWAQIDAEATRSLTHFLAARRIVDFKGPLGWEHSAVDLGRVDTLQGSPHPEVDAAKRLLLPLVELRSSFGSPGPSSTPPTGVQPTSISIRSSVPPGPPH